MTDIFWNIVSRVKLKAQDALCGSVKLDARHEVATDETPAPCAGTGSATEESFGREVMQCEENRATTESKKTLWVMLEDPQHVLRKGIDYVGAPHNTFERVGTFANWTIGALQHEWKNELVFRCRLEDHPDYQAPKVEPLRFALGKPNKPGLWCKQQYNGHHYYEFTEKNLSTAKDAMWCYIAPIPVILPPRKKVEQRLWIN